VGAAADMGQRRRRRWSGGGEGAAAAAAALVAAVVVSVWDGAHRAHVTTAYVHHAAHGVAGVQLRASLVQLAAHVLASPAHRCGRGVASAPCNLE